MKDHYAVAVDGPAGAGKSSVSRAAAKKLGVVYVDTGALYRAVGYTALAQGLAPVDNEALKELLDRIHVEISFIDGEQHVLVNGQDVTDKIRTPAVSKAASDFSALPSVRRELLALQRELAGKYSVIMDGRDIGTVVLPDAEVKIFLTASPEIRAKRRYRELTDAGKEVSYEDVLRDIIARDKNDSERKIAPLRPHKDSVLFDTTDFNLEESVERMYNIILEHL